MAECSLSTGRICVPRARASSMTSGPATTSVSLLARATILPASRAAQVPRNPTAPTIALKTRSVSRVLHHPDDAVQARQNLDARAAQLAFGQRSQLGIGEGDESRPMRDGLLGHHFPARMSTQAPCLEPGPAVMLDHAHGALPDRARRAEDHDMSE